MGESRASRTKERSRTPACRAAARRATRPPRRPKSDWNSGSVQPSMAEVLRLRGANSNYHNNAIQYWKIDTDGSVSNVRV